MGSPRPAMKYVAIVVFWAIRVSKYNNLSCAGGNKIHNDRYSLWNAASKKNSPQNVSYRHRTGSPGRWAHDSPTLRAVPVYK